jgi:hydrogenase nickel incorporation protein HypA/HybF
MHEMGIAMSILDSCRAAMAQHGGGRLEEVRIAVGELSAIEPELLRFAWEAVVGGGPHASCRLAIDWRPARQRCPHCGEEKARAAGSWLRVCPDCGQPLQLEGGDELDILHLSFVSYDADRGAEG